MPKQTLKKLLEESISIIRKDPTQLESLLQLSKNTKYITLLCKESSKNTNYWVTYLNNNELSFINQNKEIRLNKKINNNFNFNILLWKEYISNNPLNYYKLPYKMMNNKSIINIASKNKQLWINYINNIDDYIIAPLPIKKIPEIIIKNIKCINTFNIFVKKMPKELYKNKDILLKIITIDPASINSILNYNLIYKKLLNDNYFLFLAIKINIDIINFIKYKWNDECFILIIINYLLEKNKSEPCIKYNNFIKQIINYLIESKTDINYNIIKNIIINNYIIFTYLPEQLKLSIPFIYDLIKKNHNTLVIIINEFLKIVNIINYPYKLIYIKPVHTFSYILNEQLVILFLNALNINPLTYNYILKFKNKINNFSNIIYYSIYKNPLYLLSNRNKNINIIIEDFKSIILKKNYNNTLYIWDYYNLNKITIYNYYNLSKLEKAIIIFKEKITNLKSKYTNNIYDIDKYLLNWTFQDFITNKLSFNIIKENNEYKQFEIVNNNKIKVTLAYNKKINHIFKYVNYLIFLRNKLFFSSNLIESIKSSQLIINFLLATYKGFILPSDKNKNKITLCPELLQIICNNLISNNYNIYNNILAKYNHIDINHPFIENIENIEN
jgi:hypothetical protein